MYLLENLKLTLDQSLSCLGFRKFLKNLCLIVSAEFQYLYDNKFGFIPRSSIAYTSFPFHWYADRCNWTKTLRLLVPSLNLNCFRYLLHKILLDKLKYLVLEDKCSIGLRAISRSNRNEFSIISKVKSSCVPIVSWRWREVSRLWFRVSIFLIFLFKISSQLSNNKIHM